MLHCNGCHALSCELDHSYCHTCAKEVCEGGDAHVHRSIGHDVQPGLPQRALGQGPQAAVFRKIAWWTRVASLMRPARP
jgi:hypothetical protein